MYSETKSYFKVAIIFTSLLLFSSLFSLIPIGIYAHKHQIANKQTNDHNCTVVDYAVKTTWREHCTLKIIVQCPNSEIQQETDCFTNQLCVDLTVTKCTTAYPVNSTLNFITFDTYDEKYYGPNEYKIIMKNKQLRLNIFVTWPVVMGVFLITDIVFILIYWLA